MNKNIYMEQVSQEENVEEQQVIQVVKEHYVLELKNRTLSHIIKVEHLDDNTKMYFDAIQSFEGKDTFMRLAKTLFVGLYKVI